MMFSGLSRHSGIRVYSVASTSRTSSSGGRSALIIDHFGAMNHHVGDLKFAQIQQAAEHVAVLLFDLAFVMQQIDRAAQPLGRRQDRLVDADLDAEHLHQHADDRLDHGEQRSEQVDHQLHRTRDQRARPGPAR